MTHTVHPVIDTALFSMSLHSAPSTDAAWSDAFLVASPRLVIPQCGAITLGQRKQQFVATPLTVLAVDASAPYRMRRFANAHAHVVSLVVVPKTVAISSGAQPMSVAHMIVLRGLLSAPDNAPTRALALEEFFATWLQHSVERDVHKRCASPRVSRAVVAAQEFLADNTDRTTTLADIARAASISPFHLARQFKASTGATLHQSHLRLRIAKAIAQLDGGECNFTRLALDLGFASHAHFSNVFRSIAGCTPTMYRRRTQRNAAHAICARS